MSNSRRLGISRGGSTLIEVMASCVLASALLVPSLSLLIDALRWSTRIETKKEMLLLADGLMNSIQFRLAQEFQPGNLQGNFASEGYPEIRYRADWQADDSVDATRNWMSINIQVWWDKDQNGKVDTQEAKHSIDGGTTRRT